VVVRSGGLVLVALSALFGGVPILGWGTAIVGLPAGARRSVSLTIAVSTLALVYGIFSLTLGA
jgi:hypothetical protein